jgi:hypothetical protein
MHTYKDIPAFLGAFAKLRKATFSFAMSVCLSVRIELGFNWMIFMKFDFWVLSKICPENSSFICSGQE